MIISKIKLYWILRQFFRYSHNRTKMMTPFILIVLKYMSPLTETEKCDKKKYYSRMIYGHLLL